MNKQDKDKAVKFDQQAAQGDMLITRINLIPDVELVKKEPEGDVHIVTHSESGHHHVVAAQHVNFFQAANDPFVSYLDVKKPTKIEHLRGFDTHMPIMLDVGTYQINRQREYDVVGVRQVAD